MKLLTSSILVFALLMGLSMGLMFDSEAKARTYYNEQVAKPKFVDVEIIDIQSELDATEYVVAFRWELYDNAARNNPSYASSSESFVVSKSLSNVEIEKMVKDKATERAKAYTPPKPLIQHKDHLLYNKKISVVIP